jgi:hypothetical protein
MMKKLFVLMLVLGLASAASAAAGLAISVGDDNEPADSDYYVLENGTLTLDVHATTDIVGAGAGEGDWVLICDEALGTIRDGNTVPYGDVSLNIMWTASGSGVVDLPEGYDGDVGTVIVFGTTLTVPSGTVLFDDIVFTCLVGEGDVTIILAKINEDWEYMGDDWIYDTVVIHQIPEPATIALLGLGGLLLRRRR